MNKSLVLFSVLIAACFPPATADFHQASRNSRTGTYACSSDGSAIRILLLVVCASTGKTWDSAASFDGIPTPKFTDDLASRLGSSCSGATWASEELDLGDTHDENIADAGAHTLQDPYDMFESSHFSSEVPIAQQTTPHDQESSDAKNPSFLGPRPYIDVTAFGAKGDGLTNDTHAIQSAINAACSTKSPAGVNSGGGVYFPPGNYLISQQQAPTPANVSDLSIPTKCSGLYFFGGNTGNRSGIVAGQSAPASTLRVVRGPRPSGSPIFFLQQGQPGMTQGGFQSSFQNLSMNCYNQCVWIYGAAQVKMRNVGLGVETTGLADNTPLKLTDTFWFEFVDGGALQTQSAKVPVAIMTGEDTYGTGIAPQVGLVTFRDVITNGGGFLYDQRIGGSQPGNIIFENVTQEQGAGSLPFLKVEGEGHCNGWGPLTIIGSSISDNNPGTPFLQLSGCAYWVDLSLINVTATGGGHAVQVDSGRIINCTITGGWFAAHSAVNASGLPVSGCGDSNPTGGWDIVGPSRYGDSYFTGFSDTRNIGAWDAIPFRAGKTGERNASLGLDSLMGVLGGPGGSSGGWDTSFARTDFQTQSLSLALADPPASLSAAVASGGSVEQVYCSAECPVLVGESVTISGNSNPNFNRTVTVASVQAPQLWSFNTTTPGDGMGGAMPVSYFYVVEATLRGPTCLASSSTGPSQEAAVAPIAGKQAVNLSWNASRGTGIVGYCIWRGTSLGGENAYSYVPGATSTSFSDTGKNWTPGTLSHVNNTFPVNPQYVFGLQGQGFTNSNMLGHVTLTDGKKIVTFSPAWRNPPVCMTNDQSTTGASKAIPTTTTLTIVGGPTDVVDYICFGNPQ
jgi:hypothetical protein